MTTCILFEDSRKRSGRAYEVLARKIVGKTKLVFRSPPRGDLLTVGKAKPYLARLAGSHSLSKVIVCVDSHSDPGGIQGLASAVEKALANSFAFAVKYITVVHALESWLLEDGQAVHKILGIDVSDQKLRRIGATCQPDRALSEVSSHFDKTIHDQRIAQEVDVNLIASRNPSFRRFVNALKAAR